MNLIESLFIKPAGKLEIPDTWVLLVLLTILMGVLIFFAPEIAIKLVLAIVAFSPVWLPIALAIAAWSLWIGYIRSMHIASQEMVLLEIRIPREVEKSPRAMEAVFDGLHIGPGEGSFIQTWWDGNVRPWWSVEIASLEGQIHFYIWTRAFFKDHVEAQLYAQYPDIEIITVEDYTQGVTFDPEHMSVWGCDFKLTKPDPYPIKTYVDYELDKDPKTEFKIDPSANMFEYLSSIGPGEQIWLQILFRTNKDKRKKGGLFSEKKDRWKGEADDLIQEIRDKTTPKYTNADGQEVSGIPNPTPGQVDTIKAIERSTSKNPFDVGIRGIYITQKEAFKPIRIAGLTSMFKQFGSGGLNGIAPSGWLTEFVYPWQDFRDIRKNNYRKEIIEAYQLRSWFHPPYQTQHYVLNTEELATIYHFPGEDVRAPGLSRIPSTRSEAPTNLPI